MKAESVQAKQYIVEFPNAHSAQENWPQGVAQDPTEANLSTETRKVATLSPEMVERLRAAGAKIFENRVVSIPPGEIQEAKTDLRGSVDAKLKESIYVHGADKLHKLGIRGNSSPNAPTMVTIDTGIAPHKDLQVDKRGIKFYDVFDKREEPWNDKQTHGTHVSGIMMANGAVRGMAPDARFIGIKVLNDQGSGTLASVMAGIDKAIEYYKAGYKPMVVNMSLGGGAMDVENDPLVAKVKEAADLGIYFAIAAGNEGPSRNSIGSPGTTIHPRVITVAAFNTRDTITQKDDRITRFSSRGGDDVKKGQDALRKGGGGADGYRVLSTINEDGYARYSGTSMASPHMAGALGLIVDLIYKMDAEGSLKVPPEEINAAEILRESFNDHKNIGPDVEGLGELRVDKAAELLVKRYGKQGTAADPELRFEYDLAGNVQGIDYEASVEQNAKTAQRKMEEARVLFLTGKADEAVELALDAVSDVTDAQLYQMIEQRLAKAREKSSAS